MKQIIFLCSIGFYLIIASNLFATWFEYFKKYTSRFDRLRFSYMTTLVVAAAFWPVVVPVAYLSLLKGREAQDLS
ncbi:MAG TPA: hypothetical protein DCY88_14065 [Cyanobacteria bacterium UBA11372]|nr:hypothetical protein [Cyanobacteria bacterium UBA11372]